MRDASLLDRLGRDHARRALALIQALVAWLADRFDAGERLPLHETFWITENAWRAHRYGVKGWLVDLDTGKPAPTRERIVRLTEQLEPYAARYDSADRLDDVRALLAGNGSDRQRYVFDREGVEGLARWLVEATERSPFD